MIRNHIFPASSFLWKKVAKHSFFLDENNIRSLKHNF